MQLKALMRLVRRMTDDQCRVRKEMCGLRGGRELHMSRVADQSSAGRSCTGDWTGEVPANVSSYRGGTACISLRGAGFLADGWNRLGNLALEPNSIATPRQVGVRNDKGACWWPNGAATESWRRDLDVQVSSLVFGLNAQDDYIYPRGTLHRESTGRSWAIRNTSNVYEVE